jgi:hypothetical protein
MNSVDRLIEKTHRVKVSLETMDVLIHSRNRNREIREFLTNVV